MIYKDGDIITSTIAPPTSGILLHRGIVIVQDGQTFISHNTPCKQNEFEGNIIVEPLAIFLAEGREIISVTPSKLNINNVAMFNEQLKYRKFDSFDWNCEHYVTYISQGEKKSYQLHYWVGLAVLAGTSALLFFGSKFRR